jgi:hypothetical protein
MKYQTDRPIMTDLRLFFSILDKVLNATDAATNETLQMTLYHLKYYLCERQFTRRSSIYYVE